MKTILNNKLITIDKNMKSVKLHDKEFKISITDKQIDDAIQKIADQINYDLKGKDVIFLAILNGSFMFAADLFRKIDFNCEITFLKLSSYQGTSSGGAVKELIGFNEDIAGKTLVILEDIVDTGNTLSVIHEKLAEQKPAEIKIASLLYKPEAYKKPYPIDYTGISIANDFVVGYGLDYDGLGRNLKDIYKVIDE